MPVSIMLGAQPSEPLVPNWGPVKTLLHDLEENREYRFSPSQDGSNAEVWVQIAKDVSHHLRIKGQLKAMG